MDQQKGFDLLLDIFVNIANKHPDYQLVILGEGKERTALKAQIVSLGLQQRVLMPGFSGNLHDWYQTADIFVCSSRLEGLSCVLMEAMAYGLPVISFDCKAGPAELIEHNVNGLLVEAENTTKFTTELSRLIEDKELRDHLAINAIKVRQKYSMEEIAKKWYALFDCSSVN